MDAAVSGRSVVGHCTFRRWYERRCGRWALWRRYSSSQIDALDATSIKTQSPKICIHLNRVYTPVIKLGDKILRSPKKAKKMLRCLMETIIQPYYALRELRWIQSDALGSHTSICWDGILAWLLEARGGLKTNPGQCGRTDHVQPFVRRRDGRDLA